MSAPTFELLGLSVDLITMGLWGLGGLVVGFVFVVGDRPLGVLGDVAAGVIGGALAGWASLRAGVDLASLIPLGPAAASGAAAFLSGGAGALVLIFLVRALARLRR